MSTLIKPIANDVYAQLDAWIDSHFEAQVQFLQSLIRVPTDTPPGNNTPHAQHAAQLLEELGFVVERYSVPAAQVEQAGLCSITNLIVRRRFGKGGCTIALNAHGDVVPPGEGWIHDPYGGKIEDGKIYGRAAAVSKCDFSTYAYALKALEAVCPPERGGVELHFTYDEEFGGELGPGWLLANGHTHPDLAVCAGFSYQVITAHNGCLQLEVTVHGHMAHAAIPDTGVDALRGATALMGKLYAESERLHETRSKVAGITHPYINIGQIAGGTHTNVVPGRVVFKLDRRMIPEENPAAVEHGLRDLIAREVTTLNAQGLAIRVEIKRLLLCNALYPLAGNAAVVQALQRHAKAQFGEDIVAQGTPLYTDARLYAERGIPAVLYGAGPRTVLESNAKRADEHLELQDLRRASKVVARMLHDVLNQ